MQNQQEWGVEKKSILSEQWKVEGDDVSVSFESRRERVFLGGNVSRLQFSYERQKSYTPFSVFMFNGQRRTNDNQSAKSRRYSPADWGIIS